MNSYMKKTFYLCTAITCVMALAHAAFSQETRSLDGFGNNPYHPEWGAANFHISYQVPTAYADGYSQPAGQNRPNARHVSNLLASQQDLINDVRELSAFTWAWGQFIDHDITLTKDKADEFLPIAVPVGDLFFDPQSLGGKLIPMKRSGYDPATGTEPGNPRRHINAISAYIDGSAVYGSDEHRARWLRSFVDGKLKTSAGELPPYNTVDGEFESDVDPNAPEMDMPIPFVEKFFVCGDFRANENPNLLAIHSLFVREHNRICAELKSTYPHWTDEQLYQHSRRRVGGIIQAIVYEEWLPTLGVHIPDYNGYDPEVNAQIMNVFSAAAYRYGHTTITPVLKRLDDQGQPLPQGDIDLRYAFFNPNATREVQGIEPYLNGMARVMQQELDTRVIDDLRNFLFGQPGAGGLDLVSINIQRGRDRGLPDLNAVRKAFGLTPYASFQDINPNGALVAELQSCYAQLDRLDPWVGMLAEEHMTDALFGPTAMVIIESQFQRLRDGDRFYYETDPNLGHSERFDIKNTRLADVIRRNTGIANIQDEVFRVLSSPTSVEPFVKSDLLIAFPNPASGSISTQLDRPALTEMTLRVYDISGRDLIRTHWPAGEKTLQIDFPAAMRPGYYWISVTAPGISHLARFVKI